MRCENGVFYVDMDSYMDEETMAAYETMEVTVEATDMGYPSVMTAGQVLKDASLTAAIANQGVTMFTMKIDITNRKVLGSEKLTTPAGTFDCIKITHDVSTRLIMKISATSVIYLSREIGVVKTESFNKKGKLVSYDILTKITK